MSTIGRNRTKKIAELKALLTKCEVMSLDLNFIKQACPPDGAWKKFEDNRRVRLTEDVPGSKYTIQVHSNLWYILTPDTSEA